jgi:hypothetical protein
MSIMAWAVPVPHSGMITKRLAGGRRGPPGQITGATAGTSAAPDGVPSGWPASAGCAVSSASQPGPPSLARQSC